MSFQSAYDAIRAWLKLGPTEHVVITVEPTVEYTHQPINAFDFHDGRLAPKPIERKASPMKVAKVNVKVVKAPEPPEPLKRGRKKRKRPT
jgi:hypothetical protein